MVTAEYIIKNTEENTIHGVRHVWYVKKSRNTQAFVFYQLVSLRESLGVEPMRCHSKL
jgi:hypothetical protein